MDTQSGQSPLKFILLKSHQINEGMPEPTIAFRNRSMWNTNLGLAYSKAYTFHNRVPRAFVRGGILLSQTLPSASQGNLGECRSGGVSVFEDGAGTGAHSSVISAWSLLI